MASEFDLICKYFVRPTTHTRLSIGDDCALVEVSPGTELAISTDMLVSGTHFFPDAEPYQLGHKVLAVNLSDMAAMGATPRWCLLAAALPEADEAWIAAFARGFFSLADQYAVDAIGGDTTCGPLNFCVQIMGEVPAGHAIKRSGALPDDDIWVSGELGDAALGLAHLQQRVNLDAPFLETCLSRLHVPSPRVELGLSLRSLANSCIDLSDGLLGDLRHILHRSKVGAELWLDALPSSNAIQHCSDKVLAQHCALAGGDDYELCFTASAENRNAIDKLSEYLKIRLTRVGRINTNSDIKILDADRNPVEISVSGFDHFKK